MPDSRIETAEDRLLAEVLARRSDPEFMGRLQRGLASRASAQQAITLHSPAVAAPFFAFVLAMRDELAANAHKGDRRCWLSMSSRDAVAEVLYHAAKLAYAIREHDQGDGPAGAVLEHAADVGLCALMAADVAGVLVPTDEGRPVRGGD